jgi:hypothetical protein
VTRRIDPPARPFASPLLNALAIAAGALAFAALVLVSLVAFLVIASLIAALAAVVGIRAWWQRRRQGGRRAGPAPAGRVIEGEFRRVPSRGDGEGDEG